ncbi:MAG TPA: M13 family metallopeptidase N-terminal domain-containing protein, partial [Rhodoglobus sp.]|nr:M13 family metallopeptidase N-terminal domain-containing protein [Rhodoglobus sp.]
MTDNALSSGIDTDELDTSIRAQDDLFRHVNGKWIERTEIPSDKARYGSFYLLAEEAEKAVRDIIIESQSAEPGTEGRKVGDLYASFLDEARIQALGAKPIAEAIAEAEKVDSIDSLLETLGRLERGGSSGFFQVFVDNDPGQPERYLVFLEQGGLGLPDESYYREEKFAEIRTKYLAFVERMLGLAGLDDPAARAARIVALETELATHHWDNVANRDSEKTYNPMLWSAANDLAGAIDMDVWLNALGVPDHSFDEVVVRQPSFMSGLEAVLTADNLPAWRDWLAWQVIRSNAAYLSSDFVETNFDFYGKTLT